MSLGSGSRRWTGGVKIIDAFAAAAEPGQDPARLVGGVYAANTVGAIVGSLVVGLVLVPWVGSQIATQALIGTAALSGVIMLMAAPTPLLPVPALVILVANPELTRVRCKTPRQMQLVNALCAYLELAERTE